MSRAAQDVQRAADSEPSKPQHLFVYGTLRAGSEHAMHRRLATEATLICPGRLPGMLYRVSWYPAWVEPGSTETGEKVDEATSQRVIGDIFLLHDQATLAWLDAFEGCAPADPQPHEYERVARDVRGSDGNIYHCWVYRYQQDVTGLSVIRSGDFLRP